METKDCWGNVVWPCNILTYREKNRNVLVNKKIGAMLGDVRITLEILDNEYRVVRSCIGRTTNQETVLYFNFSGNVEELKKLVEEDHISMIVDLKGISNLLYYEEQE